MNLLVIVIISDSIDIYLTVNVKIKVISFVALLLLFVDIIVIPYSNVV
jgi:hypothetical protein